jgi:ribosomal-protein-alanine N-acetyltransferase
MRVRLQRPTERHSDAFLAAVLASRRQHGNLVRPPASSEAYGRLIAACRQANYDSFLILHATEQSLVGVVEISNIVRGLFQSAFLGYYGFVPYLGQGLVREGLGLAIDHAFKRLKLHRLEANIQPDNERSIQLVRGLGFKREGYSPRYLKISGRWRDHERWAILADEWGGAS